MSQKTWRCLVAAMWCGWMGGAVPPAAADESETTRHLPFVELERSGVEYGVRVQNLHPSQPASITTTFLPQNGGDSFESVRPWLGAGAPMDLYMGSDGMAELIGSFAMTLKADRPIAAIVRGDWQKTGAAAMYSHAEPGHEIVVPLVLKSYFGQTSMVTIQNTDPASSHHVEIDFHRPGGSEPEMSLTTEIRAGTSSSLHLGLDERFVELHDGFVGSLIVRSADAPISVQAFVFSAVTPGATYAFEGRPADRAAKRLYAPLIRNDFYGTTGIAVANPGDTDDEVRVTYVGSELTPVCAGQHLHGGPAAVIPARSSLIFHQGAVTPGAGEPGLPRGCLGSAIIETSGSGVVAMVIDADPELGTAAAYTAASDEDGAEKVYVPHFRSLFLEDQLSTGIQVMNLGEAVAAVSLDYAEPGRPGEIVSCGSVCEARLAPGAVHTWFPPAMFPQRPDIYGSATITSDQPIAVIVNDASATGTIDSAIYNGIPSD